MAYNNKPIFVAVPRCWATIVPATLDTSLTAPTNTATLLTAGAAGAGPPSTGGGSKIDRIRCMQLITIAAPGPVLVNLFRYDGTTYHFFDFFSMPSLAISTTIETIPTDKFFDDLVIPAGWSIRATVPTAAGQSSCKLIADGGDL